MRLLLRFHALAASPESQPYPRLAGGRFAPSGGRLLETTVSENYDHRSWRRVDLDYELGMQLEYVHDGADSLASLPLRFGDASRDRAEGVAEHIPILARLEALRRANEEAFDRIKALLRFQNLACRDCAAQPAAVVGPPAIDLVLLDPSEEVVPPRGPV